MTVAFNGKAPNYEKAYAKAEKKAMRKVAPNIRYTKEGNPYYKTNICKKIVAGLTLAGAVVGAGVMAVMTKNPKVVLASLGNPVYLGKVASTLIGASIIDAAINHNHKKEADQMARVNRLA